MMDEVSILSGEEFRERTQISDETLKRWIERGLLIPVGQTSGKIPFFSPKQVETVEKISTLLSLGYDEDNVLKIIQKIGLPSPDHAEKNAPQKLMTVGELASLCTINARTIKHWEEKGILEPDARSEGGFRLYSSRSAAKCRRILDLQNMGYTLEQIKLQRELLMDLDALTEVLKGDLSDAQLSRAEELNDTLKKRLEEVKASSKSIEDLLKKRNKMISTLRSLLSKQQKEKKQNESKEG
jgi:DNA-binding transcriptional MerR regulator